MSRRRGPLAPIFNPKKRYGQVHTGVAMGTTPAIDLVVADLAVQPVIDSPSLQVLEIVDTGPTLNNVNQVAVQSGIAYVISGTLPRVLTAIDVSNPAGMTTLGTLGSGIGQGTGIAVNGNYAYITDTAGALRVVDISNPASMTVVGTASANPGLVGAREVVYSAGLCYVACYNGAATTDRGLAVVDVSTPTAPSRIGGLSDSTWSEAFHLALSGSVVFLVTRATRAVRAIDVSTPSSPSLISSISTGGGGNLDGALDIIVVGNYAFVTAGGISRLTTIDVSSPASMSIVGGLTDGTNLDSCSNMVPIDANTLLVAAQQTSLANYRRLTRLDISSPTAPTVVQSILSTTLENLDDMAVEGDHAFVAASVTDALVSVVVV